MPNHKQPFLQPQSVGISRHSQILKLSLLHLLRSDVEQTRTQVKHFLYNSNAAARPATSMDKMQHPQCVACSNDCWLGDNWLDISKPVQATKNNETTKTKHPVPKPTRTLVALHSMTEIQQLATTIHAGFGNGCFVCVVSLFLVVCTGLDMSCQLSRSQQAFEQAAHYGCYILSLLVAGLAAALELNKICFTYVLVRSTFERSKWSNESFNILEGLLWY